MGQRKPYTKLRYPPKKAFSFIWPFKLAMQVWLGRFRTLESTGLNSNSDFAEFPRHTTVGTWQKIDIYKLNFFREYKHYFHLDYNLHF